MQYSFSQPCLPLEPHSHPQPQTQPSIPSLLSSYQNIMQIMNGDFQESPESPESSRTKKQCKDTFNCQHCLQLNKMLLSAEEKYSKLLSQNYVGELTIFYLKQRNRELLGKISRKDTRDAEGREGRESGKIKKNQQVKQQMSERQIFIETFNPKQLKKILSLNSKENQSTETSPNPEGSPTAEPKSKPHSTKENSILKEVSASENNRRKQFCLVDLKKKASERLKEKQFQGQGSRSPLRARAKAQVDENSNNEFRFY